MYLKSLVCVLLCFCSFQAAGECLKLQGSLIPGGLVIGKIASGDRVILVRSLICFRTAFVAGFGRMRPEVLPGWVSCRQVIEVNRNIAFSGLRCSAETVTPSKEHLARIARERKLVRAAKERAIKRPDILLSVIEGFQWPVVGPISGVYGSQRYYNGVPGSPHYGVDIALPTGTPVHAPASGIVTLAEEDLFYSGGTIILDHGYRLSSSFLHLSRVSVFVGDEISQGDVLGEIGSSGRATGPRIGRVGVMSEWIHSCCSPMPKPKKTYLSPNSRGVTQPIDKKLLSILVCPVTKVPVKYDEEKRWSVRRVDRFLIRDGIGSLAPS